jgi:hypothetical protein
MILKVAPGSPASAEKASIKKNNSKTVKKRQSIILVAFSLLFFCVIHKIIPGSPAAIIKTSIKS